VARELLSVLRLELITQPLQQLWIQPPCLTQALMVSNIACPKVLAELIDYVTFFPAIDVFNQSDKLNAPGVCGVNDGSQVLLALALCARAPV